jgi:hypothetical protein
MPATATLATEIVQTVRDLAALGITPEAVHLGKIELESLAAVIGPRYDIAVRDAREAGVPFYWNGHCIHAAPAEHAFRFQY